MEESGENWGTERSLEKEETRKRNQGITRFSLIPSLLQSGVLFSRLSFPLLDINFTSCYILYTQGEVMTAAGMALELCPTLLTQRYYH